MRTIHRGLLLTVCLLIMSLFSLNFMIAVVTADTATPPPLVSPTAVPRLVYASNGQWSEMYSDSYGTYQLYFDTDRDRPLTDRNADSLHPAWSPDGRQIAYVYDRKVIYVMNADGSNPRRLTPDDGSEYHSPAWSPDGTTIAYGSTLDNAIYEMDADGSNPRLLVDGVDVWSISYSPDGTRLMFTSRGEDSLAHIYTMDADGSNLARLLPDEAYDASGAWSPDGESIAYVTSEGLFVTTDEGQTARHIPITGSFEFALEAPHYSLSDLDWSPDGTKLAVIVYSRDLQMAISTPVPLDRVGAQIAVIDVATGDLNIVTYGFDNDGPDWRPVLPEETQP